MQSARLWTEVVDSCREIEVLDGVPIGEEGDEGDCGDSIGTMMVVVWGMEALYWLRVLTEASSLTIPFLVVCHLKNTSQRRKYTAFSCLNES